MALKIFRKAIKDVIKLVKYMVNDEWVKLTIFSIKNQYYEMPDFPSLIQKKKKKTLWKMSD